MFKFKRLTWGMMSISLLSAGCHQSLEGASCDRTIPYDSCSGPEDLICDAVKQICVRERSCTMDRECADGFVCRPSSFPSQVPNFCSRNCIDEGSELACQPGYRCDAPTGRCLAVTGVRPQAWHHGLQRSRLQWDHEEVQSRN